MPYPNQYQGDAGFGGTNFQQAANPSPTAYPIGNYGGGNVTAASRVAGASPAPVTTPSAPAGINVTAGSTSPNPFGIGAPDLSLADPNMLARLDISNLIYSPSAGGYVKEGVNYSGMGNGQWGGDAGANRQAAAYYNYIGGLPTANRGSPALMNLTGGNLGHGPSYNSILGGLFNNANPIAQNRLKQAGFTPTYRGPYGGY